MSRVDNWLRRRTGTPTTESVVTDADVLRYRAERERRVGRKDPRIEDAEREFSAQLARDKASRKGGRPKKASLAVRS